MSVKLTQTSAWKELAKQFQSSKKRRMTEFFEENPHRATQFSLQAANIYLDYSKNRISKQTLTTLCDLAKECHLEQKIKSLFTGESVNFTENRPALHTLLRAKKQTDEQVSHTLQQMRLFVESVYDHSWRGFSDKPISDVVNIGIGGSDLGPHLVTEALAQYAQEKVNVHFVSNIDGTDLFNTLKNLNPETTLFIVASKSFTTIETLTNANTAKHWILQSFSSKAAIKNHFVAITANPHRATEFGIAENNTFAFWDWVGGRYSLWSAIGLPIALAIGMDNFMLLLNGANEMDEHFQTAPFERNMPVLLAIISIWYINFYHCHTQAIIPYDENLALLPSYLQQLDMESNGKSVDQVGKTLNYETAPIIWGGVGSNGQHAFHQLLHQSERIIPVDFIICCQNSHPYQSQHEQLFYNCIAQSQALMEGQTTEQAYCELFAKGLTDDNAKILAKHKAIPGNKPSNTLVLEKITPQSIGALIALYEHKVFVQGIIWQINSFDQYGVELGKQLANSLQNTTSADEMNPSTKELLTLFKMSNQQK